MSDPATALARLTGAQILVDFLVRQRVPFAAGIPGHGCWAITDALLDRQDAIRTVQVMHEQSAVHLADGYFRATGKPMLAFTSIGPGAMNTLVGMGTAYVDSTAVALVTGSPHTYMRGHGLFQEFERRHHADNPRVFEPVVKEWWQPSRVDDLPFVLHRAWNAMVSGRPGPILLDLAMDLQAEAADVRMPDPETREARGRVRPAADDVERAAATIRSARRPVIVAGGGAILAEAWDEVTALAERLGAPVVTTWNGKGAIDETHELAAQTIGDTASTCGNALAASADVLISVGNRFTDWSASSYRKGVTFAIPPSSLVQLDIDPREIGKNYPVEVGLVGDAQAALRDLLDALGPGGGPEAYRDTAYFAEIQGLKNDWFRQVEVKSGSDAKPMTMARAVREVQRATTDDAIVVTGAGLPQGMVKQRWVTRRPRTHLTSGGFSTMGFTLPAAIGAQLARPERQVIAVCGDGDFLQTMQELQAAVLAGTPVCTVVLDNSGWISIKGGQDNFFGRTAWTDFVTPDGSIYSPDFAAIGRAFGIHSELASAPDEVEPAVRRALASGGPSLVHVKVDRDLAVAGPDKTGWWDAPSPANHPEQYQRWLAGRAEEQHR
ncbi:MAG TPA: thiamine pyrophosphate-binding protein [Candidatus Limnocylindrales bacterium]|nr:thiamine pyrophosphate-binding protein [Candidatus Limnocylindrales bacterium]